MVPVKLNWPDNVQSCMPDIRIISDDFEIPQLDKKRRIYALLPHDYDKSKKHYPVLYLQDAQNLFDENAPFGNWGIDKHMAELASRGMGDLIIVAIDHGGRERIKEYSPYYHRSFGKAEGIHYAKFIIDTLKPYVDKKYRTLPDREHNGIGGSSMGGLISAYIGLVHSEYFSKLMIFSPSFWFSDRIYFNAFNHDTTHSLRLYIYGGERESKYMSRHIHRFYDAVKKGEQFGKANKFNIVINDEGEHSEYYWGQAFTPAVEWLFFNHENSSS